MIGVNNPHLTEAEVNDLYRVCADVGDHILLIDCDDVNDIRRGIVYACTVEDAAAVFEEIDTLGLGSLDLLS